MWALVNLGLAIALRRRWRPGVRVSVATLAMDVAVGATAVYLALGGGSMVGLAFFLVVIAGSIRLGTVAAVATALASSLVYGAAAYGVASPFLAAGRMFMFVSLALVVGLMARELERERRVAVSRAAQADAMREMGVTLRSSLDLQDVFEIVLQHGLRLTGADTGGLLLVLDDEVEVAAGEPFDEAEARAAATHGEARFPEAGARLVVPLASGEGVTAVLGLRRAGRPFTAEDRVTINALAGSVALPLANALRYRRSTQEAASDAVTGLLNHREMVRRLDAELGWRRDSGREMAFILVDLDHFKQVNDSMGHQHGDSVLRAAARIVRETVRAHDLVARYGGDELAVIVLDSNPDGAEALAGRLLEAVRRAAVTTSPGRHLTFSVGVAGFPGDALTSEELVMAADQALYVSKRGGRDRVTSCRSLVARVAGDGAALLEMLRDGGPQVALPAGHALDARLGTPGRSSAVAALAQRLAEEVAPEADLDTLRAAAFVQDVGLLDGAGADHAGAGAAILREAGFTAAVVEVVELHHAAPGRAPQPPPLEARLLAVADAFEALVVGREGTPLSPQQALERMRADHGAFDPAFVAGLGTLVEEQKLPPLPAPPVTVEALAGAASDAGA